MSMDVIKERFVNEIEVRAEDDHFIDRNEEREILQIAIQMGIPIASARAALAEVCAGRKYVLESAVLKAIQDEVESAVRGDGKIDQKEFESIIEDAKRRLHGRRNDREIKKMIVTIMEDSGLNSVKTGWFSNWYSAVKRDLGMT